MTNAPRLRTRSRARAPQVRAPRGARPCYHIFPGFRIGEYVERSDLQALYDGLGDDCKRVVGHSCLCRLTYLARRGSPANLGELAGHDLISGPADVGDEIWIARRAGRIERQSLSPRVHSGSATGGVACPLAGFGIASASIWMCAEALASGAVVEILADYALDPSSDDLERTRSRAHPLRKA